MRGENDVAQPCTYCGVLANSVDHVVPRWLLARAEDAGINLAALFRLDRWIVPSCLECNSALGNRIFRTMKERRAFVHAGIRRRWAKYLRIPNWSECELGDLAPTMRESVEEGLRVREWVKKRLAWTGVGREVELATVYEMVQQIASNNSDLEAS